MHNNQAMITLAERVNALMKRKKLGQDELAQRVGVSQSAVNKVLKGKTNNPKWIVDLAAVLGVTAEYLLYGESTDRSSPSKSKSTVKLHGLADDEYTPESWADKYPVAGKLPVFGFASATNERESLNPDMAVPMDWVEDSMRLGHIAGVYGLMIMGDSMEPRYFHGEIVFVNPRKPPGLNEDCIVEMKDGIAHIKRLLRQSREEVVLRQYNPDKELTMKKSDIKGMYAIIGRQ